jgi:hypothetical protein
MRALQYENIREVATEQVQSHNTFLNSVYGNVDTCKNTLLYITDMGETEDN